MKKLLVKKREATSIEVDRQAYVPMLEGQASMMSPAESLIRILNKEKIICRPGAKALDFGCGDGRHCEYLAKRGYHVIGTDVSNETVRLTKKRNAGLNVQVLAMEPDSALPLDDRSVELVLAWETLFWVGSKEACLFYLREFFRVLRKKGSLVLTMPTERHFAKTLSVEIGESVYSSVASSRMGCVLYAPNLYTLKKIFAENGFQLQRCMSYDHCDEASDHDLDHPFSMYVFHLTKNWVP